MMTSGGETTEFEDIVYDWENSEILDKLYRELNLNFNNKYDRDARTAIEEAVYKIVKRYR